MALKQISSLVFVGMLAMVVPVAVWAQSMSTAAAGSLPGVTRQHTIEGLVQIQTLDRKHCGAPCAT